MREKKKNVREKISVTKCHCNDNYFFFVIYLFIYFIYNYFTCLFIYFLFIYFFFLCVVMMLDIDFDQLREGFTRYLPIGATVGVLIMLQLFFVLTSGPFELDQISAPDAALTSYSNTEQLGLLLYTYYVYPFELAAVLLLLAMIAAISLTLRRRSETRKQQPHEQVAVKRKDRVRLVKMKAESRQDG